MSSARLFTKFFVTGSKHNGGRYGISEERAEGTPGRELEVRYPRSHRRRWETRPGILLPEGCSGQSPEIKGSGKRPPGYRREIGPKGKRIGEEPPQGEGPALSQEIFTKRHAAEDNVTERGRERTL